MIDITELDNKVTVVTECLKHLESAAVGVWIKAGARHEKNEEHGIAHVLEHMAFKGTHKRSAEDIVTEIENVGGDMNASTSAEFTAYYAQLLKRDVPLALNIFADILTDSIFDESELEREKHVIIQEIGASQDSPEELVYENFQKSAFQNQTLGRPIMGTAESVAEMKSDDLREYLKQHYSGNNIVVSVVGNVKHSEIVKIVKDKFGGIHKHKNAKPQKAQYVGGESRDNRKLQEAQILIGFEGRAYHVKDFYASQMLALILGGGMASRLFQEIREKKGLCYAIYANHAGYIDTGLFSIYASTEKNDVKELINSIVGELRRMCNDNVQEEEINRAREQIRAGMLMAQEKPMARAGQLARQIHLFNRCVPSEEIMERLNAINGKRIESLAEKLFCVENPTIAAIGPINEMMHKEQFVNEMIK